MTEVRQHDYSPTPLQERDSAVETVFLKDLPSPAETRLFNATAYTAGAFMYEPG